MNMKIVAILFQLAAFISMYLGFKYENNKPETTQIDNGWEKKYHESCEIIEHQNKIIKEQRETLNKVRDDNQKIWEGQNKLINELLSEERKKLFGK